TNEETGQDKPKPNPAQRPVPQEIHPRRESVRAQQERLNPNSETRKNNRRRWLWISAAVVSLIVGLSLSYPQWQSWFGNGSQACLFPEDDAYHILILPFSNQANCVDEAVEKRQLLMKQLNQMTQRGYRFTSKFYDLRACEHTESALALMAENCDANLYGPTRKITSKPAKKCSCTNLLRMRSRRPIRLFQPICGFPSSKPEEK
ncbi:MAG: hypothetical protein AAGM67_16815, partial [Bacteroidota bacterium]